LSSSYYGNTDYTRKMSEKDGDYRSLCRKAERIRRMNGDISSLEEAQLYRKAAVICGEVVAMNLGQHSVKAQWTARQQDCVDRVEAITRDLAPNRFSSENSRREYGSQPFADDDAGEQKSRYQPAKKYTKLEQEEAVGQKSKNATKDVTQEMIGGWYKDIPNHGIEDVAGMDAIKEKLYANVEAMQWEKVNDRLDKNSVRSFFFYGMPGGGKTYLVEAFAHDLMENAGYKFISLTPGDIHSGLVGVAEKIVQAAFDEAIDNAPSILFIDEIESVCGSRELKETEAHAKRLTSAFLIAYNKLRSSGKKVIFMGATNHPSMVDTAMLDRVALIQVPLPPVETREEYFEKKFSGLELEEGYSVREMAEYTDNYSFRDCDRLVDDMKDEVIRRVIDENSVYSPDGTLDKKMTDEVSAQALADGEFRLTEDVFMTAQKNNVPTNKAKLQAELDAWVEEAKKSGGIVY
jgi:SpoVK/Ycf46/Vps4 family AAA+-type ATPase